MHQGLWTMLELLAVPHETIVLENVKSNGRKFGRLRIKDGHIISSIWIQRKADIARNNYYVAVDMYEDKELFGKIEYFIVHEFREKLHILAYIQWTSECTYR
uniref:Uncharacterized protein n=1 Tax=Rhizophagus irregularis (strain DAOM 181602 / DAOM 197198 / MUCL 43194) TaxID=747089 RepID=U9U688_RHIID